MDRNVQRWKSARKAELVVAILKKEKTRSDAWREDDPKRSEVKRWIQQFLQGGQRSLEVNSKDLMVGHRREAESLQREIGERVLENDLVKRASSLLGEQEDSRHGVFWEGVVSEYPRKGRQTDLTGPVSQVFRSR